jgi:hypothetical protein
LRRRAFFVDPRAVVASGGSLSPIAGTGCRAAQSQHGRATSANCKPTRCKLVYCYCRGTSAIGLTWGCVVPAPKMSPACVKDDHEACAHWAALGMEGMFSRGGVSKERTIWLCACPSHASCPLHGREETSESTWRSTCTCPAAPAEWARFDQVRARVEQGAARRAARKEQDHEVLSDVTVGPGATRDSIRSELMESLARHDLVWSPNKIETTVDTLASTTGNRWLVAPRAAIALGRAFRRSHPKA